MKENNNIPTYDGGELGGLPITQKANLSNVNQNPNQWKCELYAGSPNPKVSDSDEAGPREKAKY